MSRVDSACEGLLAITGPRWQDLRDSLRGRLPSIDQLRRIGPILTAVFVVFAVLGLTSQLTQSKQAVLSAAEDRLALMADIASERLQQRPLEDGNWQSALAASLPTGATSDGRLVLLADLEGDIQARAPFQGGSLGNLLSILGPQQPLTTFGADAGVLRIALVDGTDAIVTVRNISRSDAQVAFVQPVDAALAGWRQQARIEITILVCAGLVLALLGGGLWFFAGVEAPRRDALSGPIVEALPGCGLWRWNLARGHVHWSAPMYRLLGMEPGDGGMAYGSIARALHPDDDLRGLVDRHLRERQPLFDETIRLRHVQGHYVRVRMRGHIAREPDSEPYLTGIAVAVDQDAAPVSADANVRLRDAVETISEAFVLWDDQNRLVMCNSKYQQFYGLPNEMIRPGTPYEEVIASASQPIVRRRVAVAGNDNDHSRTYEAQLEDGRWLHINERRTKDGGYVSIGTDITMLKESQQRLAESEQQLRTSVAELRLSRSELEQQKQQLVDLAEKYALEKNRAEAANRAKSEFLANISHELRTPLNAVIGFSEVMHKALFGPLGHSKYQEYARDIHASGAYLLEVINDILDMSKIEAGRMTLDHGSVDVADIIEDSMKIVSQTAAERNITVSRHGPSRMMIEADRRALKQVFLNLLSNAVKFTREDGSVDVHLSRSHGNIRIAIKDTGVGIPEAEIAKLGRPFEQVENQFSKSHQGSGLGLAISSALVEAHGGALRITSREGEGTNVVCTLPIRAHLAESEIAAASA